MWLQWGHSWNTRRECRIMWGRKSAQNLNLSPCGNARASEYAHRIPSPMARRFNGRCGRTRVPGYPGYLKGCKAARILGSAQSCGQCARTK
eukprot:511211-Rhodomonas_salina.1